MLERHHVVQVEMRDIKGLPLPENIGEVGSWRPQNNYHMLARRLLRDFVAAGGRNASSVHFLVGSKEVGSWSHLQERLASDDD
jgi:hypothetical protein